MRVVKAKIRAVKEYKGGKAKLRVVKFEAKS